MNINEPERIYFDVMANLFRGMEGVGGKLKVTNKRLYFHAHAMNLQTGDTVILMDDIVAAKERNTMGLVPNGMSIITRGGIEYKFVLWNRKEIINFINQQIQMNRGY